MSRGGLTKLVRSLPRLTFLLASKNHDVDDDQLYFMSNSAHTRSRTAKGLSTERNWGQLGSTGWDL
jgi:hypothetical protein